MCVCVRVYYIHMGGYYESGTNAINAKPGGTHSPCREYT